MNRMILMRECLFISAAKYRKRILPIAIFSYDKIKEERNRLTVEFPFHQVLSFEFLKVELKKQNWRDYLKQDNPVAAALLSKMGYAKEEKIQVKLEFLRMLTRLELDPARIDLIAGIFETYLKLNENEEDKLIAEIRKLNPKEEAKVMEITTSWHEKGKEEGMKEGMREGEKKAEMKIARKMLKDNYDIEQIRKLTGLSVEEIKKAR
jgi:predicted transposase/invertase (TIGR01784 family)